MTANPYDQVRAEDALIAAVRARHPMLIDLTTARVERLLEKLGRPQDALPNVVHIAGTNGKGSTAAYLRAIGEAAGLKVHVWTSPHLVRFAERIRIAGELITEAKMAELVERLERAAEGEPISFFELSTVMAIQAFADTPADMTVIEVGLGGRHDATNVFMHPATTVITPIDYDHVDLLGPTLTHIAGEKAGIMREHAPCIVAYQPEEAFAVLEAEAEKVGAPLFAAGRDFDCWEDRGRLMIQTPTRLFDLPPPSLFGVHQFDNAGVAAIAAMSLDHPKIDEEAVGRGLASAVWPARFQRLTAGPLAQMARARGADLWLDGGHNPHAGQALAASLPRLLARHPRPVVLIVGMLDRKDAYGFFAPFETLAPKVFTVGFTAPNATPPDVLAATAGEAGLAARPMKDVTEALQAALAEPGPAPLVLICGGLYFAGDVLAMSPETWPT